MTMNDRIILDEVLIQRRKEIDSNAAESDFFELFTAEQVLKDFDLSYDEIDSGLVGGSGDGGIDGFYLLVNGELVQEAPDYGYLKKNITLDLIIVQAKTGAGFQETPVERFLTFSEDILDLSRDVVVFKAIYNEQIVEAIERFREVHQQLAARFPLLRVSYFYASKGGTAGETIKRKVDMLEAVLNRHFPSAKFNFSFWGATQLLDRARRVPQTTYSLTLAENPISSGGQVGFVCLVRLRDFFTFIADEQGTLRRHIFEANVRDYQGRTEVNEEIQKSLQKQTADDFWWLNNGVSILASRASLGGKILTIEDPQIVNGLQTSTEVYHYFEEVNPENDDRKILVRVVVPVEAESRDRIIKATNSQTAVQQASLRATDKIHRDIEEYLRPRGLFYDRRKNYYKNEGKPRDKVVGISHLAQSVMSIVLQRPDTARGRPSSLLKKDNDYSSVYSEELPIQLYYVCAEAMRRVVSFLSEAGLDSKDRNNLRFYVAMHSVVSLVEKSEPTSTELANLDITKLDDTTLRTSLNLVKQEYAALGGNDQVAKGPSLLSAIQQHLKLLGPLFLMG